MKNKSNKEEIEKNCKCKDKKLSKAKQLLSKKLTKAANNETIEK